MAATSRPTVMPAASIDLAQVAQRLSRGGHGLLPLPGAELAPEGALGARLVGLLTALSTAPTG